MFETKILTNTDSPEQSSASEGGALRAFDWAELVARIAATNELRCVVKGSGTGFGGFAALADNSLGGETEGKSKHAVNPNALGAGKDQCPKEVVDDKHETLGDRKQT